ncbi:RNA polymerase sigma factor [Candidatus Azambacteria bacterium]|nr:RNA polymerase sigma factor [Candidatus Azambacteria bacterium]
MNFAAENLKDEEILAASLEKPVYFKILVDRYQEAFTRKALGILKQREEAEDIVQEAFVKIYLHGAKFKKMEGVEFKSWAYKILMNAAISRYRKTNRKRQMESNDPLDLELASEHGNLTENLALTMETKSTVNNLVSRLPKPLARLVSLYYIEDKSYKEIAAQESITVPALKMKLFRAKKLLKNLSQNQNNKK